MDRVRWLGLGLLLLLSVACTAVQARNTHGSPDPTIESQAWWGDAHRGVVVDTCFHGTSATTSVSIATCQAYALETSTPRRLQYLEELTARTVTYSGGDGRYWLLARSNLTVTPGGWTCIAGTHYCWLKSATPPVIPSGMVLLQRSDVVAGAITAPVILAPWRRTTPYTVAQGTTLMFAQCPDAGPAHLFHADGVTTGLVKFATPGSCGAVYAEWWGAKGDGTVADQTPFLKAASDALEFSGGTILGAGPAAHYRLTTSWQILHSNITFDGQDALFTSGEAGTVRIIATDGGTQADSGETDQFLHNVHLKNYRVGSDATFPDNQMRGGALFGCVNCSIENVRVENSRGTSFTTHRCQHCTLRNLHIRHGNTTTGGFCGIILHSNYTLVENFYCEGAGAGQGPGQESGLQMKGGVGNRFVNVTLKDLLNPLLQRAVFQRGDDPNGPSGTDPNANPYPFPTLTTPDLVVHDCKLENCYALFPDVRRASIDTQWTNIRVENAPSANCFAIQEAQGDIIQTVHLERCLLGMHIVQGRLADSVERNFTVSNFTIKDIGVGAVDGDGLVGFFLDGAGSLSAEGEAIATGKFRNLRISNGLIQNVAGIGLRVVAASDSIITNVTVQNAAVEVSPPDSQHAIQVTGYSRGIRLLGNHVDDNQTVPTLTAGIRLGENLVAPTMIGNTVTCTNCVFGTFDLIQNLTVGRYIQNSPGECTMRTVDTTLSAVERCRVLTHPGDIFQAKISCTAQQGFTNQAYYERTVLVYNNAGALTVIPNSGTGDITMESDPDWDVTQATAGVEFRWRVRGDTGQTVDWICDHTMVPMVSAAAPPS